MRVLKRVGQGVVDPGSSGTRHPLSMASFSLHHFHVRFLSPPPAVALTSLWDTEGSAVASCPKLLLSQRTDAVDVPMVAEAEPHVTPSEQEFGAL